MKTVAISVAMGVVFLAVAVLAAANWAIPLLARLKTLLGG